MDGKQTLQRARIALLNERRIVAQRERREALEESDRRAERHDMVRMRARAREIAGHAPGCVVGHQSGACSCGLGSSGAIHETAGHDMVRSLDGEADSCDRCGSKTGKGACHA